MCQGESLVKNSGQLRRTHLELSEFEPNAGSRTGAEGEHVRVYARQVLDGGGHVVYPP